MLAAGLMLSWGVAVAAFGMTISQSGALSEFFRHRFSTKYSDDETGLYYYGYRFYHPMLMRWLNRDPISENGGLNLNSFCGNNPVCRYDKDGRAYFAKRQLAGSKWREGLSNNPFLDELNIEWSHEQLFYGTPDYPMEDIGYFDDGQIKSDPHIGEYEYVVTESGYDDCVMAKAVANVSPYPYNVIGFLPFRDNCQSYAAKLRAEYDKLMTDRKVLCDCFGPFTTGSYIWLK